ncbi:MAG: hypothetical protein ACTHQQ_24330 [Solirubrobacteraceae bacterium]
MLGPVPGHGSSRLSGLELAPEEPESLNAAIRHIEFLDWEIPGVDQLVAQQTLSWPEIQRLMTMPGVT